MVLYRQAFVGNCLDVVLYS